METAIQSYCYRDLHPGVFLGTASDRYAGWIGQIYSKGRYETRLTRRPKKMGGQSFVEEVLPVESVEEYFQHFRVLEMDFTFYRPLREGDGRPTQNLQVLRAYASHLPRDARLILKVPQVVFARKILRQNRYTPNEDYLNPELFVRRFYEPAVELLDSWLAGLIFEQEYQKKEDRVDPDAFANELDSFFAAVPRDTRYHVELRTETFLHQAVFGVLERHGVGQVFSHWTWLPPLARQFSMAGRRFIHPSRSAIIRLMTPRGMRYEEAYTKAFPFSAIVEGLLDPRMVEETAVLMKTAVEEGVHIHVIINNRAGGNAPRIAQEVAGRFLSQMGATEARGEGGQTAPQDGARGTLR
jgi:uncharacterized protein YecE (DUF72 family)